MSEAIICYAIGVILGFLIGVVYGLLKANLNQKEKASGQSPVASSDLSGR